MKYTSDQMLNYVSSSVFATEQIIRTIRKDLTLLNANLDAALSNLKDALNLINGGKSDRRISTKPTRKLRKAGGSKRNTKSRPRAKGQIPQEN